MSNTSMIKEKVDNLWTKVSDNAGLFPGLMNARFVQVESLETAYNKQVANLLDKLQIPDRFLNVPAALNNLNISFKDLYLAIEYLDTDDAYSVLDMMHEILDVVKKIGPQLFSINKEEQKKIEEILETIEDIIGDTIDLLMYGFSDDEHSEEEWAALIKKAIHNFTDQLNQIGVGHEIIDTINKAITPVLNIIQMIVAQNGLSAEKEENNYWYNLEAENTIEATYQRTFGSDTERVIHNVNEKFDEIYKEVKEMPHAGALPTDKTHLEDIWKESITRFRSLDPEGYEDVEYAFDNLRENIDATFDFITDKYPQGKDIIDNTIRPHVEAWLTLPNDFRPTNWVEIIHIIIKNIQHSLRTSLKGVGPVSDMILPVIDKLEYILSTVDNDAFKLLITPKEAPEMHRITLPDLLPPEPKEKIKEDDSDQAEQLEVKELSHADVHHHTDRVHNEAAESGDTPPEKLSWSKVIYYLCFDKEHGAMKYMEPNLRDVIHDLYYRDWLSYRLEHLEEEVMSIFTIEKYQPIWEDIKAKLLDEKGVNLGEFLTYLIEKVVATINELITFVKETIQYIIDEIFNLVKAIIQFFEKVDLPDKAKDFLKTIPLFNDMPDNVTILHIIAAIPYTLYTEFIRFEVTKTEAV
jgi:hypothetical protein